MFSAMGIVNRKYLHYSKIFDKHIKCSISLSLSLSLWGRNEDLRNFHFYYSWKQTQQKVNKRENMF